MNWKQRAAKIFSVFLTGYGAGISIVLSLRNVQEGVDWFMILLYPILSGLIVLIPYFGKILGEYSNENKTETV